MKINSISNQPKFGMAKLTQKGQQLVSQTYGQVPQFIDKTFSKKNQLSKLLASKPQAGDITAFFSGGLSDYAIVNSRFYKSQIGTFLGRHQIKKFLNANVDEAAQTGTNKVLNPIGEELKTQLIKFFDKNISNEGISAKQGKKVLSLVEPYMEVGHYATRNSIISDKIFSK